MKKISEWTNQELIKECIRHDVLQKDHKRKMDTYKSELQKRATLIMDDRNLRFFKFYGEDGSASVTDSLKLEVLNMEHLKTLLGEGLVKEQVTQTDKVEYKFKPKFEKAMKALFTGDYSFEITLADFLDQMSIQLDVAQKKVLLKKLKGEYEADKEILLSVCGYLVDGKPAENTPDFEVELYYIYKIKNGELIRAYLQKQCEQDVLDSIRKCMIVESSTAIKIDYETEA